MELSQLRADDVEASVVGDAMLAVDYIIDRRKNDAIDWRPVGTVIDLICFACLADSHLGGLCSVCGNYRRASRPVWSGRPTAAQNDVVCLR